MSLALVVAAPGDGCGAELIEAAAGALEPKRTVRVLDLPALGFADRMSPEEPRAYHTDEPIVDPMVGEHAGLVADASALVFVFPTRWWQPPPVLKAWLERVMVPGVSFVFDDQHRVRPNLRRLEAIAGVSTYDMSAGDVRRVGDGGRRMLLRALRANVPKRVKTAWVPLYDAAEASSARRGRFAADVGRKLACL